MEDLSLVSLALRVPELDPAAAGPRRTSARGGPSAPSTDFSTGFGDSIRDGTRVVPGGDGSEDTGVDSVGVIVGGGFGAVPPTLGPPNGFGGGPRGLLPFGSSITGPLSFLF